MCSYTCNQVRSAVALAHIDGAPAARHHLPYLLYITVTPPPPPFPLLSPRFPLSLQQRLKKKKKFQTGSQLFSVPSVVILEFLELFPGSCTCGVACCKNRKSFPSFGKEWSSLCSHRRKSSASPFGSQTVKVAAHLQTPTCTFFFLFFLQRARSLGPLISPLQSRPQAAVTPAAAPRQDFQSVRRCDPLL